MSANALERSSNRHPALALWRSMIFSENRVSTFRDHALSRYCALSFDDFVSATEVRLASSA